MKTKGSNATLLRFLSLSIAVVWSAPVDAAAAQSRLFSCAHAQIIELTVTGPDSVSASPVKGKPMAMKRDPANPLRFFNTKYAVTLTPDQGGVTLQMPGAESTTCLFGTINVQPFVTVPGKSVGNP